MPAIKYKELATINREAKENPDAFIASEEFRFSRNIKDIAQKIATIGYHEVIMLSGPSGSGKTTTAHKLVEYLAELGVGAVTISLDDFYLGKGKAPVLEDGTLDYETVNALDIEKTHKCLAGLLKDGYCEMPVFNFQIGRPEETLRPVRLGPHDVAIVEGIHALNPVIVDELPDDHLLKMYISVENSIMDGDDVVISPRNLRLVRRMIRDSIFRDSSPQITLEMWKTVVQGEEKYLIPYKDTADILINSFHGYEACLFRQKAMELLKTVEEGDDNDSLARELLLSISLFEDISPQSVPKRSLLREFIGGGIY